MENNRTEYADDGLRIEPGTQPEDIRAFVRRRVLSPHVIDGVTIWDFNGHKPNMPSLRRAAKSLRHDRYMIPYQVSGVWGYMLKLLPDEFNGAEILAYDSSEGTYQAFPNYRHYANEDEDEQFRAELRETVDAI